MSSIPSSASDLNILLLGGGKRVSFARQLIRSAEELGRKAQLWSYELSGFEPIREIAEIVVGRLWDDPGLDRHLLSVIEKRQIDLVVSHVDPAAPALARLARLRPGIAVSSNLDTVELCLSKVSFQKYCELRGLPIVPRWDGLTFPFLVKPDIGSASQGIELIHNPDHLARYQELTSGEFVAQRYVRGHEFTVDAYVDKSGLICGLSPRQRIKTAGGEVSESTTVLNMKLIEQAAETIQIMKLRGPLSIQFMSESGSNEYFLLEVNTRFGGGVTNSIAAGVDLTRSLLQDHLGMRTHYQELKSEVAMKRYFSEVFN